MAVDVYSLVVKLQRAQRALSETPPGSTVTSDDSRSERRLWHLVGPRTGAASSHPVSMVPLPAPPPSGVVVVEPVLTAQIHG